MPESLIEGEILTDGTEQVIATVVQNGTIRLHLDMLNAVDLDIEIVIRAKLQTGDSSNAVPQTVYLGTFRGHGGQPVAVAVEPFFNVRVMQYTIVQTSGPFVTFPWEVVYEIGNQTIIDAVNAIGSGTGGALPFPLVDDNTVDPILGVPFVGVIATGTLEDTESENLVYYQFDDVGNVIDWVAELNVQGFRTATNVRFTGFLNGANDVVQVFAYDWTTSSWSSIGFIDGQNNQNNNTLDFPLFLKYTGTGVDAGRVAIRMTTVAGTNPDLNIDRLIVEALNTSISTGYQFGAIWINTDGGTPGSQLGTNGTADRPVDNLADAISLAADLGTSQFRVVANSSIVFAEPHDDQEWVGQNWDLDLNGQSISNAIIEGAVVTGAGVAAESPFFRGCSIGDVTLPPSFFRICGFSGTFTLSSPGRLTVSACEALTTGLDSPTFDLGAAIAGSEVTLGYTGDVNFLNIAAGDEVALEGNGGIVDFNGTGGKISIRGIFEQVIDSSSLAVESVQIGNINRPGLQGYDGGQVFIDTNGSNTSTIPFVDGTANNPVSTLAAAVAVASAIGGGLRGYFLEVGSSILLDQAFDDVIFTGAGATVDLNGQSVSGTRFNLCIQTGVGIGAARRIVRGSLLDNVTYPTTAGVECVFLGTFTMTDAGPYRFDRSSAVSGAALASFDFGGAVADTSLFLPSWNGPVEVQNMGQSGNDTLLISGGAEVIINANCVGGTITYAGDVKITDNSGGAVTVVPGIVGEIPDLVNDLSIQRNTAGQVYHILMVLASDSKTPAPGLTLSGQRLLDNGAFEAVTGSFVDAGSGMYKFLPSQADTNGKVISWRFVAATADDRIITFNTVP